jgi:predicted methyltransferase
MGRLSITTVAAAVLLAAASMSVAAAPPAYVKAAVEDASRPQADKDNDKLRKPDEMVVLADIKPGSDVLEILPGGGDFTRVFSKAIGAKGHLYEAITAPAAGRGPPAVRAIAGGGAYTNINVIEGPLDQIKTPAKVDVAWTSRNYHDLPPAVRPGVNKAVFDALKPGGVYVVLDHSAPKGAGEAAHLTLHRADEDIVKTEVLAAGFKLDKEYDALRNPNDDRTKRVFDNAVRGQTDQFILKFRKPK